MCVSLLNACLYSQPLSPPPSPASAGLSDQLIDLGFGDDTTIVPLTTASEGIIGQSLLDDTPLIATAPEPLVPAGQSHTISYEPSSYMADTSPPPPPEREPTPPPPPPPKKEPTPHLPHPPRRKTHLPRSPRETPPHHLPHLTRGNPPLLLQLRGRFPLWSPHLLRKCHLLPPPPPLTEVSISCSTQWSHSL